VGDAANKRITDEIADLCRRHTGLRELSSVGFALCRKDESFEDTRIRDGREGHRDRVWNDISDTIEIARNELEVASNRFNELAYS